MAEVAAVTAAAAKRSLETQHVPDCEIHEIPKAQRWGIGLLEKKQRLITGSKIKLLGDYKKKHGKGFWQWVVPRLGPVAGLGIVGHSEGSFAWWNSCDTNISIKGVIQTGVWAAGGSWYLSHTYSSVMSNSGSEMVLSFPEDCHVMYPDMVMQHQNLEP